eukprot:3849636-Amphidinium_carterae.1
MLAHRPCSTMLQPQDRKRVWHAASPNSQLSKSPAAPVNGLWGVDGLVSGVTAKRHKHSRRLVHFCLHKQSEAVLAQVRSEASKKNSFNCNHYFVPLR